MIYLSIYIIKYIIYMKIVNINQLNINTYNNKRAISTINNGIKNVNRNLPHIIIILMHMKKEK